MEGSVEVRIQHLIVVLCQLQQEAKGDRPFQPYFHLTPPLLLCFLTSLLLRLVGSESDKTSGSYSRARIDARLREVEDEDAYHRYKECGITVSKIINPVHLSYQGDALADLMEFVLIVQDDWYTVLDDIVGNLQLMSSFEALLFKSSCSTFFNNLLLLP
ncbi:hypothetical protein MA16_Dca005097 [Dendrobium catenatum]|uniref:Uncharacterized protein n=1 Tax=Dendrobium catenatum TaxID=906689 RepID=A0A2I0VL84_9ASPA|nr:hypothetical protein MA16_Dca005097 [Dendrobium catenatum]